MNPNPNAPVAVTAAALVELRQHTDAVRLISEKLYVKSMGPADHIRTKHEVKAFVESGDAIRAQELLDRANTRRALNQAATQRIIHQERQGHTP